jgi:hypothetical protein
VTRDDKIIISLISRSNLTDKVLNLFFNNYEFKLRLLETHMIVNFKINVSSFRSHVTRKLFLYFQIVLPCKN